MRTERPGGERVIVAAYGVFAVAAGSRAAFQLGTQAGEAPLAYALSAVAAAVYIAIVVLLHRASPGALRAATWAFVLELAGVLGVGTLSVLRSDLFPEATVWSDYGGGYGWLPLVLPLVGLWWTRRAGAFARRRAPVAEVAVAEVAVAGS